MILYLFTSFYGLVKINNNTIKNKDMYIYDGDDDDMIIKINTV